MSGDSYPRRGEVFWTDLEPTRGAETKKRRPGLIVSNDIGNEVSLVVMIAPITSKVARVFPFEVLTSVDGKPAKIMLNQCRAVDKSRLQNCIGKVDQQTMEAVDEAIKVVFGLS